jgi:hypothetical protein
MVHDDGAKEERRDGSTYSSRRRQDAETYGTQLPRQGGLKRLRPSRIIEYEREAPLAHHGEQGRSRSHYQQTDSWAQAERTASQ